MFAKVIRQLFCGFSAAVIAATGQSAFISNFVAENVGYTHQSIELYPNGRQSAESVTLDGMMPRGAVATAVDVSDDYTGLAAYDITITKSGSEYQPTESRPIFVEIVDPAIKGEAFELWHIRDDDVREQILDFTAEEGKISFYAAGFSVYEIVEGPAPTEYGWQIAESFSEIAAHEADEDITKRGFYLSTVIGNAEYYFTNTVVTNVSGNSNRNGLASILKSDIASVLDSIPKFYFEQDATNENQFYIYTNVVSESGTEKKYLQLTKVNNDRGSLNLITDSTATPKTLFTLEYDSGSNSFYCSGTAAGTTNTYYLNRNTKTDGYGAIAAYFKKTDDNVARIKLNYYCGEMPDDPYHLDGETRGIVYVNTSDNTGRAMMKTGTNGKLDSNTMLVRRNPVQPDGELYVPQNGSITMWTFHCVGKDEYKLTADNGQYLCMTDTGLTLVATEADGTAFKVTPGAGSDANKIRLTCSLGGVQRSGNTYQKSTNANSATWLNLAKESEIITDEDFVVYSASKVGVSDKIENSDEYVVHNDSQIVIYTRIWNQDHYDFYVLDHQGRLIPATENGGNLMWIGSQINTMLWTVSEYTNLDGTLNGYYDFYNPYSDSYLVPQTSGDVLSDHPVGVNLEGRRNGYYYTTVLGWDDYTYSYSALKAIHDDYRVEAVEKKEATGDPACFYFAIMQPLKPDDLNTSNDYLTEVETIDNNEYGITMKMVDFNTIYKPSNGQTITSREQFDVLGQGTDQGDFRTINLLTTDFADAAHEGYPTATQTGNSLYNLFGNAPEVNHLFVKSTYEASGYFEFDSCQNYATLLKNGQVTNDFTVYQEIGTDDKTTKPSMQHGQFMPYNTITPGVFADEAKNGLNLYDAKKQALDPNDPRKNEKLYLMNQPPDYYHGMELSASFVQTSDGRDAWGHDIIFEFTGDDDFWLYVDGELILDLGGIHSALDGKVNFHTGEVSFSAACKLPDGSKVDNPVGNTTLYDLYYNNIIARTGQTPAEVEAYLDTIFDYKSVDGVMRHVFKNYTSHTMKIFYMERGAGSSNLHMRFNLSYVTPGSVVMHKEVAGGGDIDYAALRYPYQIWYYDEKDTNGNPIWKTLNQDHIDHGVGVFYLNPKQAADCYANYKAANGQTYENVYYLYPGKDVSLCFPSDTMMYKVYECGLNTEVYESVQMNDTTIVINGSTDPDVQTGLIKSDEATVKERPNMQLVNNIDPGKLKTLTVEKKLVDKDNNILSRDDDSTVFSFRLYLEDSSGTTEDEQGNTIVNKTLQLTYIHLYYVVDDNNKLCRWEPTEQKFMPTGIDFDTATADEKAQCQNFTSPNGKIDKIPAKFKIKVPYLLPGMKFEVEEREADNPIGYDAWQLNGYECMFGEHDYSYAPESGSVQNIGTVKEDESPYMRVTNKRGFGIQAEKIWSDDDLIKKHDPVYVAVYVNGVMKPGTVRRLTQDKTKSLKSTVRYFFEDVDAGTTLNNYEIREITLKNPVIADDGITVTSCTNINPIGAGQTLSVQTTDYANTSKTYTYLVEYESGALTGVAENARIDTINNIRSDGIAIRKYTWGDSAQPLAGAVFSLQLLEDGQTVPVNIGSGTFTSDSRGIVTTLYNLSRTGTYILTETSSPTGYIGMEHPVRFRTVTDPDTLDENGLPVITGIEITENDNPSGWTSTIDAQHIYLGVINVYNKPLQLSAYKVKAGTTEPLAGAHFALYRGFVNNKGQIMKDYYPIEEYKDLVTGTDGIIPNITQALPKNATYFLTEKIPPTNYTGLSTDLRFTIDALGRVTMDYSAQRDFLTVTENGYRINVPNERGTQNYFFNIEKLSFLDKNIHGDDTDNTQKFVFRVERFNSNDSTMTDPLECFYVSLNCTHKEESGYPYTGNLDGFAGHEYNAPEVTITCADGEDYTFPAALYSGKQPIKVTATGKYRITEVTNWSSTDYDFWDNSQYLASTDSRTCEAGTNSKDEPYLIFNVTAADNNRAACPTASFTNCESEYAYLSAQAFAENTIQNT